MHCQRVRSFLSAYCKGELPEKRSRAIADHLNSCPPCRREEASEQEINQLVSRMPRQTVSSDFNTRLLDRIARERFNETRNKAYLPKKRVPVVGLNRMAAIVAAACFILAFIFAGGIDKIMPQNDQLEIAETVPLNDAYETVQPQSEHWVFKEQLQRATRIKNLMQRLSGESQFNVLTGQDNWQNRNRYIMPIPRQFFQINPEDFRIFNGNILPETTTVREVNAES